MQDLIHKQASLPQCTGIHFKKSANYTPIQLKAVPARIIKATAQAYYVK